MKNIKVIAIFTALNFLHQCSMSQEISTVGEIYNYEIGDEYHRAGNYNSDFDGYTLWQKIDEIVDKNYSTNGDTLLYNIYRQYSEFTESNPNWTYYDTTITEYYTNLDFPINNGDVDSVYSDTSWFNGRLINSHEHSIYWEYQLVWFVKGCGQGYHLFYYADDGSYYEGESWLVYYNKNGEEYGEPIIITNIYEKDFKEQELNVYPNPSFDKIFIKYDFTNSKNQTIEIFNIQGKLVERNLKINENNKCIEISKLPSGTYILRLTTNLKILETKFVKR
jgi:hypothetical protein